MNEEQTKEEIKEILQTLHEDIDFEAEKSLVGGKILDSFDLVTLVTELGETFDINITAKEFVAENFNSLECLTKMVLRLADEE